MTKYVLFKFLVIPFDMFEHVIQLINNINSVEFS